MKERPGLTPRGEPMPQTMEDAAERDHKGGQVKNIRRVG